MVRIIVYTALYAVGRECDGMSQENYKAVTQASGLQYMSKISADGTAHSVSALLRVQRMAECSGLEPIVRR